MIEIAFEPRSADDPTTSRRVWRIAPSGQSGTHAYFTSTSFDIEGRLLATVEIGGRVQLCRVDLRRGVSHQLTELGGMELQSFCVMPQRRGAVVTLGTDELVFVDTETGAHRTVLKAPEGFYVGLPTADNSGRFVAVCVAEKTPGFTRSTALYANMEERFYSRPRCLVLRIDLDTDEVDVIWGEHNLISHVLIDPSDPDTIVYCHEGGYLADTRLWAVSARKSHKKRPRRLFAESRNQFLVHEFFCPDGVLGVQIGEWPDDHVELTWGDPRTRHGVLFLDMDGGIVEEYRHAANRSKHVQSNANRTLIVADTFSATWEQPHDDGMLALLRPDAGKVLRPERLCAHATSWLSQASHPHPSFSPDEKFIAFTSDAGGSLSPYVVEI